jgi:hypothetical protein
MLRRPPKAAVSKHEAALILRDGALMVRCLPSPFETLASLAPQDEGLEPRASSG